MLEAMNVMSGFPVAVTGCVGAQGANVSSNVGTVGGMSTPELLAKRIQRQKAEQEAIAGMVPRPSFARRLLEPTNNHQPLSQQRQIGIQGASTSGNIFQRAAKRCLDAEKPAPIAEESIGVSVDELAQLLDDEAGADSPAKRLKFTDISLNMQQQRQEKGCSPICYTLRSRLLSCKQQDIDASLAAASRRVTAQRQQQQHERESVATASQVGAAGVTTDTNPVEKSLHCRSVEGSQVAITADAPQPDRWMYQPAEQQQQEVQQKHQDTNASVAQNRQRGSTKATRMPSMARRKGQVTVGCAADQCVEQQSSGRPTAKDSHGRTRTASVTGQKTQALGAAVNNAAHSSRTAYRAVRTKRQQASSGTDGAANAHICSKLEGKVPAPADEPMKAMRPLKQLAAVTVDAPSRRLKQIQAAAAASHAPTSTGEGQPGKEQNNLRERSSRLCAPIAPVTARQGQQRGQQEKQQLQNLKQAHPGPRDMAAGASQLHVNLPLPLARRMTGSTAAVGPSTAAAGCSHEEVTKAAAVAGSSDAAAGSDCAMAFAASADAVDLMQLCSDDDLAIEPPVLGAVPRFTAGTVGTAAAPAAQTPCAAAGTGLPAVGTATGVESVQQRQQKATSVDSIQVPPERHSQGCKAPNCSLGKIAAHARGADSEQEPVTEDHLGLISNSYEHSGDTSSGREEAYVDVTSSSTWDDLQEGFEADADVHDSGGLKHSSGEEGEGCHGRHTTSTRAATKRNACAATKAAEVGSAGARPRRACTRSKAAAAVAVADSAGLCSSDDDSMLSLSEDECSQESGDSSSQDDEEDSNTQPKRCRKPGTAAASRIRAKRSAKECTTSDKANDAAQSEAAAENGGAKRTKSAAAATKKTRVKKTAHRQNFRRHTHNGGYGFKFMSKSAASGGQKRFRKITRSGKLIMSRRKAPHMAGQGAEFVDGFAGGVSGGGGFAGKGRCFKCGQAGHWEQDCPLKAAAVAALETEMAEWRTAQAAEDAGRAAAVTNCSQLQGSVNLTGSEENQAVAPNTQAQVQQPLRPPSFGYPQHRVANQQTQEAPPPPLSEAELRAMAGIDSESTWQPGELNEQQLLGVLNGVWGYQSFRGQQLPLIQSALKGRSMLGVLPTGLGKSLTYQLPALLLQGLVVVVSPLLALMRDQLQRLPKGLPGAMLQGSLTKQEVDQVLGRAETGQLRLLYVAPEKLSARPVMQCLAKLSPLPLVCVDEAHCMAEWGQGFRPAYFRLGHLLCNVLRPRAVLALTATATPVTRLCIRQLLAIPPEQELIESPLRNNLRLQVLHCNGASKGGGIAARVVQMLTTGELRSAKSVVVYAGFKAAADSLAAQLQRASVPARPYHAGMRLEQREAVQAAFLSGALRVVVATVAFGMGVDKQDLDAVLHTCMPHSLEEYVQQVGRAGRDGRTGHCMLFLDDADFVKLRVLAHASTARRESIELLLAKLFGRECEYEAWTDDITASKKRKAQPKLAPSRHRALPLQSACAELDLTDEVMEGCLSFLQADPQEPYLTALPNTAATIDVRFHKSSPEQLADKHPVVASILQARCRKYAGTYKVHMAALLSAADRPPGELLSELAGLAAAHELGMDMGREGALVWRLERQPQDWQALVNDMVTRTEQVIRASVCRLDRCYAALAGAAIYSSQAAQERHLRAMINDYFMDEQLPAHPTATGEAAAEAATSAAAGIAVATADKLAAELSSGCMDESMETGELPWGGACPIQRPSKDSLARQMRASLKCAWNRAQDLGRAKFTGLAFARLLAGLASPAVPASVFKGCSEWGRLAAVDFKVLVEVGNQVVEECWSQQKQEQEQQPHLTRQRSC